MWSKQTNPSLWHLNRTTCCKPQPAMQLPAKLQRAHIPGAMSAAVSPTTFLPVMFSSLGLTTLYISYPSVCFVLCYLIPIAIFKLQNHQGIIQGGKAVLYWSPQGELAIRRRWCQRKCRGFFVGGTDIWEAETDTDKTMGRLETNWKVKARIFCVQYFYISVLKWI